jgi:metallophosphoesterase superfamily enzyme
VWELGPFSLSHEPLPTTQGYNLCGHIHPGVILRGRGRQRLRLPCFYLDHAQGILPAFGAFTGLYVLSAKDGGRVYAVTDASILDVSVNN